MTNEEAIKLIQEIEEDGRNVSSQHIEALNLAIMALKNEVYWEDVKQALNGWLNNTTSLNTALNEIYRAYMGRGEK